MAKTYCSEGDLVTKQPSSSIRGVIFSLSDGDMGKGTEGVGSGVTCNHGNRLGGSIGESKPDVFKPKSGLSHSSPKTGSRVSFADLDDQGNMIKTISDSEFSFEPHLTGLSLGRSLSYSAIERTHDSDDSHALFNPDGVFGNRGYDTYSLGSLDSRLSTSPIQEVAEHFESEHCHVATGESGTVDIANCHHCQQKQQSECSDQSESRCQCDSNSRRNSQQDESSQLQQQRSTSISPSPPKVTATTGKPPLPNGKSKHRPSSGKQTSWLLRLFESKMFDMSIAISYLYNSKEPGVQTYLGESC